MFPRKNSNFPAKILAVVPEVKLPCNRTVKTNSGNCPTSANRDNSVHVIGPLDGLCHDTIMPDEDIWASAGEMKDQPNVKGFGCFSHPIYDTKIWGKMYDGMPKFTKMQLISELLLCDVRLKKTKREFNCKDRC